jgi:hypothetical protein
MKIAKVKISEIANNPTMRMDAKYWVKENSKKRKIKVRFNLGRGKNYMKWKVEDENGTEYHNPQNVMLIMNNCILKNNKKVAESIFNGENKSVCAWILCEFMEIFFCTGDNPSPEINSTQLLYNPRKMPHWTYDNSINLDNTEYENIYSVGNQLFIKNQIKSKC